MTRTRPDPKISLPEPDPKWLGRILGILSKFYSHGALDHIIISVLKQVENELGIHIGSGVTANNNNNSTAVNILQTPVGVVAATAGNENGSLLLPSSSPLKKLQVITLAKPTDSTSTPPHPNLPRYSIQSNDGLLRPIQKNISTKIDIDKHVDSDYILLVPLQIDLMLTVFIYKILTREQYFENCQTYLSTYHNRRDHVACWVTHMTINSSTHSLYDFCINQTITYINYEYNSVLCIQYVFKLINIIDTITNVIAWHQAIVFIITKGVIISYWWQRKLRSSNYWSTLSTFQRKMILFSLLHPILSLYILFCIILMPMYFYKFESRRIDLTHHLLFASVKFIFASIAHIHLYTMLKWYKLYKRGKNGVSMVTREDEERIETND
ncbi:unnamed protein product [Didymodactylos carnosus]|uniref:Uncharacterized protein n=1 Tax=Didymodactylos carnosus TaxID=1234261 RepID=A0A814RE06_9BILA|nr:unnamed protein product [Didymodactylos carnosus]CAF3896455.1 unnamed protein product [Didymodactylos carnosus]